jgi:predicted RNase H-like HicB family nuclease
MKKDIRVFIHKGETQYIAECLDIAVVTKGSTLQETIANLKEAIKLYLEGEDRAKFDLEPNPSLIITLEPEPSGFSFN